MVDETEVVTAMVVVAASNIQVLKFPLFQKAEIPKCFLIISSLNQRDRQEIFSFTRLILVFSTTKEI
jgi:hypothetical protein